MFSQLGDRLTATFKGLTGRGRLTEDNIGVALREVRIALLEADVALPVVRTFLERVREKAVGEAVLESLSPGQAVIKVVHDELVAWNRLLHVARCSPSLLKNNEMQGTHVGKL